MQSMSDVSNLDEFSRKELHLTAQYVREITPDERTTYIRYVMGVANGTIEPKYSSSKRTCELIAARMLIHEDTMVRDAARDANASPSQHLHLHGDRGVTPQQMIAEAQKDPKYLEFLRSKGNEDQNS